MNVQAMPIGLYIVLCDFINFYFEHLYGNYYIVYIALMLYCVILSCISFFRVYASCKQHACWTAGHTCRELLLKL